MTEKTKVTGQRVASYDADKHFTDFINRIITKPPFSVNDNEYQVSHTFNTESDRLSGRFAEHNKSTRLLDETRKIGKKCRELKAEHAIVKKQCEEYFNGLSENERQDILDGRDVTVRSDIKQNLSLILEVEAEHHRLTLQAKGLLNEKVKIDERIRAKRNAALAVLLYLEEGKHVFDSRRKLINKLGIIHWLRMHGENIPW